MAQKKKTSIFTWLVLVGVVLLTYVGWVKEFNLSSSERQFRQELAESKQRIVEAEKIKEQNQKALATQQDEEIKQSIVNYFQSNEEPSVKAAIWTSKDTFKVGVFDDRTRRDGYAEYVCQVLYEHGLKGHKIWVQVLDVIKLTRDGDWVKLGEAHCE